jgi:hypothetical protein
MVALRSLRSILVERWPQLISGVLLLTMAVNLYVAASRKTLTNDEIMHIPAGYYHLTGTFAFNNEHPPLVKMWSALPLLFLKPVIPPPPSTKEAEFLESIWGYHARFWDANAERFRQFAFWPRVWMIPIAVVLGVVIFCFARALFGPRAGALAVALYAFEPTVLAHGRVVHNDLAAALAYVGFFFVLHAYWARPTWQRATWLGVATGLAWLTKFSLIVLAPVLVAFAVYMLWAAPFRTLERVRILGQAAICLLAILVVVNAGYYFQHQDLTDAGIQRLATRLGVHVDHWMAFFSLGSLVLPTYFLFGLGHVWMHNQAGHTASLLGMHSDVGWWYYFPVAFALKTTLPFLVLSVAALIWTTWRLSLRRDTKLLFLLVPFSIFTAGCMTSHINIGIRHYLPAFPFLFIAAGGLLDRLLQTKTRWYRTAQFAVLGLLGWIGLEAVRTFPHYIPYMNQLASARPHWWYLSDSNVEWGDDANALAAYLRDRGETRVRAALLGGWMTIPYYGVDFVNMVVPPGTPVPATRYVALGASFLNGSTVSAADRSVPNPTEFFASYRDRNPEAVFGNSIYLFREEE